jgi:predicted regulator of Ras-like GTPase activity (Roadblock/LC7/MglB family)
LDYADSTVTFVLLRGLYMMWRSFGYDEEFTEQSLRKILQRNPDIEGLAVVTIDGRHLVSILPEWINEESIALIAASLAECAALASNLSRQCGQGALETAYIKSRFGYIIVRSLMSERLLIYLCRPEAKLGLIFSGYNPPTMPLSPTHDPVSPPRPPKRLVARAKPEYDDPP